MRTAAICSPEVAHDELAHSWEALRYRLAAGNVSLEPLHVLETRVAAWHEWRVTFHILGASHAVRIERPRACLTETLSCARISDMPPSLLDFDMSCPQAHEVTVEGLLFRVEIEALRDADGRTELSAVQSGRLERAFPCPGGPDPSWTRVGWWADAKTLRIETLHSYAQAGVTVRSVTQVRESPGGGSRASVVGGGSM